MIVALTLLLLATEDPRPTLIEMQLEGRHEAALVQVDEVLETSPEVARDWGLEYLRGHLLEMTENRHLAPGAFAEAMTSVPMLEAYSRYRLAVGQSRDGHPEVTAGLLATLLANTPPRPLLEPAVRLLAYSLSVGGDCRLLSGLDSWGLSSEQRRPLVLSQASCAHAAGRTDHASEVLLEILRQDRTDETARLAADKLTHLLARSPDGTTSLLLGLTFFSHREFPRAIPNLERGLDATAERPTGLQGESHSDVEYALARSHFWQGDYPAAATLFADVAAKASRSSERARALFQQARCFELDGEWQRARQIYHTAFEADRSGNWAAPGLLATMRIDWRTGHEQSALALYDQLRSRREWRSLAERGALFLAASDISRGHMDRAATWLAEANRNHRTTSPEIAYWRGRLAELENTQGAAVRRYVEALALEPYHPLSQAAKARLSSAELSGAAQIEGERLAGSEDPDDILATWILLGDEDQWGRLARSRLEEVLARRRDSRPFLEMHLVAPAEWSVWQDEPTRVEDLLLTLGIVEQMSAAVEAHFPLADESLALTGSQLLASSGLHRQSVRMAEVLAKRLPESVPPGLLSTDLRNLLYPRPHHDLIEQQASRFGIDPNLLLAIIREESRFDPTAISAASARGLTQFVLPTARRVGAKLGEADLKPADLHDPRLSITLGAAYLAELHRELDHRTHVVVAAYNAGEDQARLWESYCFSRDPEEYYSKVGFSQTRGYLRKVGSSRAQYREIYSSP